MAEVPEAIPAPPTPLAPEPVVAPVGDPALAAAPVSPAVRAPASKPKLSAPDALSASALFGEANKKRLAGDIPGAIGLYELLTERHPGSPEADLAELSLGKLLLASGNAEKALAHFRRAGSSGGALGSEALWGETEALRSLGRASEERAALERLLELYPDGAYAKAARKRLGNDAP
jgi:tetratricopeptide (TPR) repeat protein